MMTIRNPTDWGKEVRRVREARGWTREQLASILGCSVDWVGQVERGDKLPTLSTMLRWAGVLGEVVAIIPEGVSWPEGGGDG